MIPFYIINENGKIAKAGSASNEAIIHAQAKETDIVIFEELPTDIMELAKLLSKYEE